MRFAWKVTLAALCILLLCTGVGSYLLISLSFQSALEREIDMAQEEMQAAKADMERLREELKLLLLPRDPNDGKNVVMEIRGGVGGEEAAVWGYRAAFALSAALSLVVLVAAVWKIR